MGEHTYDHLKPNGKPHTLQMLLLAAPVPRTLMQAGDGEAALRLKRDFLSPFISPIPVPKCSRVPSEREAECGRVCRAYMMLHGQVGKSG